MQIRTKLTLQFLLLVALIVASCFIIIYLSSAKYREDEFYDRLKKKAITTAEFLIKVDQVDSLMLKLINRTQKDHLPMENISIYDHRNKEIFTTNDSVFFKTDRELLNKVRLENEIRFTEGDFEILGLSYKDRFNHFVVISGATDIYGVSKLNNLKKTLILLFFIVIAMIACAGWVFAGNALAPISSVVRQVKNISPGGVNSRIRQPESMDEIGHLVLTFNSLLERLEEAFKLQKVFVASASHELRNPLTMITSQLQVALLNKRDTEGYEKILRSVLEDITDLNNVTEQLMELTKLDFDQKEISYTHIRPDDILWQVRNEISQKHPDYEIVYEIQNLPDEESALYINGNESLLKTAFKNLIENACKFSENGRVRLILSAQANERTVRVDFIDNGPGIAEEEQDFIFEPFYRSRRTSHTKGHGIGLSLVQKIVQLHQAQLQFRSIPGKGLTVTLIFNSNTTLS